MSGRRTDRFPYAPAPNWPVDDLVKDANRVRSCQGYGRAGVEDPAAMCQALSSGVTAE
jgi:hypothetical protein